MNSQIFTITNRCIEIWQIGHFQFINLLLLLLLLVSLLSFIAQLKESCLLSNSSHKFLRAHNSCAIRQEHTTPVLYDKSTQPLCYMTHGASNKGNNTCVMLEKESLMAAPYLGRVFRKFHCYLLNPLYEFNPLHRTLRV